MLTDYAVRIPPGGKTDALVRNDHYLEPEQQGI